MHVEYDFIDERIVDMLPKIVEILLTVLMCLDTPHLLVKRVNTKNPQMVYKGFGY